MKAKKKTTETVDRTTKIGDMIRQAMDEKGVSIRELAAVSDSTYEHIRRILTGGENGTHLPSKWVLKAICEHLDMDYEKANHALNEDRLHRQFGDMTAEMMGKNPELDPIERAWTHLTPEQKEQAKQLIGLMAKQTKAAHKVG